MSSSSEFHALSTTRILKFSGADTVNFLQGQLTNDINALDGSNWQYAGYCNPKGRLLGLLKLWKDGENIYAAMDSSIVEPTIERLRMYIMRSNVFVEEANDVSCVGLLNNASAKRFSVEISGSVHRLNFGDRSLLVDLKGALEGVESTAWKRAGIQAGEPEIDAGNIGLFVPQMINLDLLDGINFKKGCYTGQEIVARMHYLGKLKQRMFVCNIQSGPDLELTSGDKVLTNDKSAGHIVSVSKSSKLALAVLRRELIDQPLVCESGAGLSIATHQPYSIPE